MERMRSMVCGVAILVLSADASARRCPNVLFVLDRSGSMSEDPDGNFKPPTKWKLLQDAVVAVLDAYGDQLAFGMEMYTSSSFSNDACYNDTKIDVQPAHGTAQEIKTKLLAASPSSGTNTGEAIRRAHSDVTAFKDASRGEYIILITDGDPNCNSGEPKYTSTEIANAATKNPSIHTFVVGFDGSGGVNPKNLNDMAKAGLEPISGCDPMKNKPCYYSASNAQKFQDSINQIIGTLAGSSVLGGCDDTCFGNPCPQGEVCRVAKDGPACMPDLCAAVSCNSDQYCKEGKCLSPCETCPNGQQCQDSSCVPDLCAKANCGAGLVCDPASGNCVMDKCASGKIKCTLPLFCDPISGTCMDDPCRLINCPATSTCLNGSCMIDPPPVDMAMAPTDDANWQPFFPDMVITGGQMRSGPGCAMSGGAAGGAGLVLGGLLVAGLLARKRE